MEKLFTLVSTEENRTVRHYVRDGVKYVLVKIDGMNDFERFKLNKAGVWTTRVPAAKSAFLAYQAREEYANGQ